MFNSVFKRAKKPIIDRPVAFAVISVVLFYLFYVTAAILFVLFNMFVLGNTTEYLKHTYVFKAVTCIIFAAGIWMIVRKAKHQLKENFKLNFKTRIFAAGVLTILYLAVLKGATILICGSISSEHFISPDLVVVTTTLVTVIEGVLEELLCRGIYVGNMMRFISSKTNGIYKAAVFSAAVTGFFHIFVLSVVGFTPGGFIEMTWIICAGFLLGAIYIRTRSLSAVIIAHMCMDVMDLLMANTHLFPDMCTADLVSGNLTAFWVTALTVLMMIGAISIGVYLLRPAKQKEICRIWKLNPEKPAAAVCKYEKPVFVGGMY